MYTYSYVPISPGEDVTEIMWHNLKEADNAYNLEYFIAASLSFLQLYPEKNYQDLEVLLRKKDFNTHLFAIKPKKGSFLKKVGKGPNPIYECFYSCRPKNIALQEVLSNSGTYESNFDKLQYAGNLTGFNVDEKSKDIHIFDSEQKNIMDLITDNKIKIQSKDISDLEFVYRMLKGTYNVV